MTSGFQKRTLYKLLSSLVMLDVRCPTQLILLDLIIPIFGKKYKL
jgi:hypothetical protein